MSGLVRLALTVSLATVSSFREMRQDPSTLYLYCEECRHAGNTQGSVCAGQHALSLCSCTQLLQPLPPLALTSTPPNGNEMMA